MQHKVVDPHAKGFVLFCIIFFTGHRTHKSCIRYPI